MDALIGALETRVSEAWRALRLGHRPDLAEPERIDILKGRKEKKTVCRLVGGGPSRTDVIAKHYRLATGLVERAIYDAVLPRVPALSLHCYGLVEELNATRCWLFLEDAGGEPYSVSVEEHRRLAGRWLGLLHAAVSRPPTARLPDRGPEYYLERLRTARSTIVANRGNPAFKPRDAETLDAILLQLDSLEASWDEVQRLCEAMPTTIVHGDFVPKNVRIRPSDSGPALLSFDWACAGWGNPAVDLAQTPASSDRFAASPDLASYWDVVRDHWPDCELDLVRQWAQLGSVFRSLASIGWACRGLAFEWVDEHIAEMRVAQSVIARDARAVGRVA